MFTYFLVMYALFRYTCLVLGRSSTTLYSTVALKHNFFNVIVVTTVSAEEC